MTSWFSKKSWCEWRKCIFTDVCKSIST